MAKIFIMSIPRETATKLSDFTSDVSGKKLKKTKVGRTRDSYQALYSPKVGGLLNGLSYKPWMEEGKQIEDAQGRKLTLQDKMEQKWRLPKDYLHNRPFQKGNSLKEADMSYYQRKSWKVNDGSTILDTDNMDDELFYFVTLDSKFFANSLKDVQNHSMPYATHYIAHEQEAQELKFKKNNYKGRAIAMLQSPDLTASYKQKFVHILELSRASITNDEETLYNVLFDYIDSSSFQPGSNIDKFVELYNKLGDAKGREEIEAKHLLKRVIDNHVIYERQGTYTWVRPSGTLVVGESYTDAIEFLLNPKKKPLVDELKAELKIKEV